jgi:hypothetical protein
MSAMHLCLKWMWPIDQESFMFIILIILFVKAEYLCLDCGHRLSEKIFYEESECCLLSANPLAQNICTV